MKEGDRLRVKVIAVDEQGRIKLSRKQAIKEDEDREKGEDKEGKDKEDKDKETK